MATLGVIHLVWVPLGPEMLNRFLVSYECCPGGIDHDLIIVFNGFRNRQELDPFLARLSGINYQPLFIESFQQDIVSYCDAIRQCPYEHLCFVNSYARLQDAGWLAKLYQYAIQPQVGVVGASGSWENRIAPLVYERERIRKRPLPRRVLSALYLKYRIIVNEPYPNYHVRTNVFMLRRDLGASLVGMRPRSKREAWRFEHGGNSMTRQVLACGLDSLIVGRDGRAYSKEEWARSNIFWQGDQGNLLVTDNQTDTYAAGTWATRHRLWQLAWHEQAIPPVVPASLVEDEGLCTDVSRTPSGHSMHLSERRSGEQPTDYTG